jgi:thioredoxin 1
MSHLADVTDQSFAQEVLAADRTVIVDFWAEWCPPCRAVTPVLEKIAGEHPDVLVVKINADDNQATTLAYRAMALPTMLVFQGGEVVKTVVGAKPRAALEADFAPYLGVGASVVTPVAPVAH